MKKLEEVLPIEVIETEILSRLSIADMNQYYIALRAEKSGLLALAISDDQLNRYITYFKNRPYPLVKSFVEVCQHFGVDVDDRFRFFALLDYFVKECGLDNADIEANYLIQEIQNRIDSTEGQTKQTLIENIMIDFLIAKQFVNDENDDEVSITSCMKLALANELKHIVHILLLGVKSAKLIDFNVLDFNDYAEFSCVNLVDMSLHFGNTDVNYNFELARIEDSHFYSCELNGANFKAAQISKTTFSSCKLADADFSMVRHRDRRFYLCDIRGASLEKFEGLKQFACVTSTPSCGLKGNLSVAAQYGDYKEAQAAMACGQINAKTMMSALRNAVQYQHDGLANYIATSSKFHINKNKFNEVMNKASTTDANSKTINRLLVKHPELVFLRRGDDGATLLHVAMENGKFDVIKKSLAIWPDSIFAMNYVGETPFDRLPTDCQSLDVLVGFVYVYKQNQAYFDAYHQEKVNSLFDSMRTLCVVASKIDRCRNELDGYVNVREEQSNQFSVFAKYDRETKIAAASAFKSFLSGEAGFRPSASRSALFCNRLGKIAASACGHDNKKKVPLKMMFQ